MPEHVQLRDTIRQWADLGAFVAALSQGDHALLARSMEDFIIEPVRKSLVPEFDAIKTASLSAGALGGGISGSGPSVFMLSKTPEEASDVAAEMRGVFEPTGIEFNIYSSEISSEGVKVV